MQLPARPRLLIAGVAVLAVALAILVGFAIAGGGEADPTPTPSPSPTATPTPTPTPSPSPTATPTPTPSPEAAVCPYTGRELEDPSVLDRPALLVQVENHPIGRPTSGLNAADMVVEAPVEGDTTRFGAVYLCGDAPAAVGPVRSARYYNTDLWRQLHVITMHFGGGWAILNQFDRTGTPYVDGITNQWPFFVRRASPPAPHNVYFDVALARQLAEEGRLGDRAERAGDARSTFTFDADESAPGGRAVSSVTVYTNSYWHYGWTWDAASERWLRSDAGAPASDALTGERLTAKSVVVQIVEQTVLDEYDPGGYPRRRQHLVDSGNGVLYVKGQAHDVRWSRHTDGAITTFTYADSGDPVVLEPGKVWWEIIPVGSSVTER